MLSSYNKVRTISTKITAQSGSGIIPIIINDLSGITAPGDVVSVNLFVKNLKAFTQIKSLAAVNLPNFGIEDSETERLYKLLDVEWKSPRYQLSLYISDNSTDWHLAGAISLLNPSGYPYRIYNLMDLYTDNLAIELGENGRVGVQIENVGYGNLQPTDLITIHGSYVKEVIINSPARINSSIPFASQLAPNASSLLVPLNLNRKYVAITNAGNNPAWIHFSATATLGEGIYLAGKGGAFDFSITDTPHLGAISAISSDSTTITGIESI